MAIQTLALAASLVVAGAILGFPSIILKFPANLIAMGVLLLCIEAIHKVEKRSGAIFSIQWRVLLCTAPWLGFAIAFHLWHGELDYQGLWVAAVASPISLVMLFMRSFVSKAIPEENKLSEQVAAPDS